MTSRGSPPSQLPSLRHPASCVGRTRSSKQKSGSLAGIASIVTRKSPTRTISAGRGRARLSEGRPCIPRIASPVRNSRRRWSPWRRRPS
eukprot:9238916-Lingulodinium_polyedra.AAC.1